MRISRASLGPILAALLALTGFAACSFGDETSDRAFAQSYQAAADAYKDRIDDVKQRGESAPEGLDGVVAVYEELLDSTLAAHEDYAGLDAPTDLAPTLERLVDLLDQQADSLRAIVDAAHDRDMTAVTDAASRLTDLASRFAQTTQDMERLLTE